MAVVGVGLGGMAAARLSGWARTPTLGAIAGLGYAVLNQNAADAGRIEPVAYFGPFEVNGQDAVTTAREYNHGSPGVCSLGRVERKRGIGNIADADDRLPAWAIILGSRGVAFRLRCRLGSWCLVGP